jgi:hypothetical protein
VIWAGVEGAAKAGDIAGSLSVVKQ